MTAGVLVDSSVLLDIFTDDPQWAGWSVATLARVSNEAPLVINAVIYAEVGIGFRRIEEVNSALAETRCELIEIPREALFLAGKAFLAYRRKGGPRTAPLPDFFIGAHAAVMRMPLITRDPGRIRSYFPTVELITPEAAP